MVAYKASQTARFITAPDARFSAILIYGPDAALVGDRVDALTKRLASEGDPEIVRLGERDLAEDPDRLAVEARTRPMFADRKIVRLRAAGRLDVAAVDALLTGPTEATLVVEAGNLRPGAPLRKLFEKASTAVALPCYADVARDVGALIDETFADRGVKISREVRGYLARRLGDDVASARAELVKLRLYLGDAVELTTEDVDALVGDGTQTTLDALANAVGARDVGAALAHLDRLAAAGQSVQGALMALGGHFRRLHLIVSRVETGQPVKAVLDRMRPPLHFRQKDALTEQARRWPPKAVAAALRRVGEVTRKARLTPDLERQLTAQLLVELCAE